MSGLPIVPQRDGGITIATALPITLSTGMGPWHIAPLSAGMPWHWYDESAESDRWSPITHSSPAGMVTGPKQRRDSCVVVQSSSPGMNSIGS